MAKESNKINKNAKCLCKEPEETCFHYYSEHLKRLQSGDYKKTSLSDDRFSLKYPPGCELAAFLDIGAEAERRNELQFQEMKCCIDNLTIENDRLRGQNMLKANTVVSLQKKIAENENVILSLTTQIDQLNCRQSPGQDAQRIRASYEFEKEKLLKEKDVIQSQLKNLKWTLCKLQEEHDRCPTSELMKTKDCKINCLAGRLKEKENHIQKFCCELEDLKEQKCLLEKKVTSLQNELETQYNQFAENTCTYQKTIQDLESQISFLEQTLSVNQHKFRYKAFISKLKERLHNSYKRQKEQVMKEKGFPPKNQVYNELTCQPMKLQETHTAEQISERDRILQQLIGKMEVRELNVQKLKKLQNSPCLVSDKEYEQLMQLIDEQACDIEQLTHELQKRSGDDEDSGDILNEVAELHNTVCDSVGDPCATDPLSQRIKRLKCKIKSRLQREEARRKELSKQLGLYRHQFATLQKEINELRQIDSQTTKEDIKIRLEKEKALSQIICHINKQRRELYMKCVSLTKALQNLERVNEFLVQLV